jgi:hypothetical protein
MFLKDYQQSLALDALARVMGKALSLWLQTISDIHDIAD